MSLLTEMILSLAHISVPFLKCVLIAPDTHILLRSPKGEGFHALLGSPENPRLSKTTATNRAVSIPQAGGGGRLRTTACLTCWWATWCDAKPGAQLAGQISQVRSGRMSSQVEGKPPGGHRRIAPGLHHADSIGILV